MKKHHVSVVNAAGEKGKKKKKIERLAACMQAKGHHTYHSRVCSHDTCVLMNSTSASIRRASPVYPTRVVVVGKLARRIRYCCCYRRLSQLHQLEHPVREQPVAVGSADIEAMLVLGQGFAVIDRNSGVALTSTSFTFEAKTRYLGTENRLLKVFDSWISLKWLCSKVIARKPFFSELARSAIDDHESRSARWPGHYYVCINFSNTVPRLICTLVLLF